MVPATDTTSDLRAIDSGASMSFFCRMNPRVHTGKKRDGDDGIRSNGVDAVISLLYTFIACYPMLVFDERFHCVA